MRVVVDRSLCAGIGICESLAPEFFEVGDNGELLVRDEQVPGELLDDVRRAVDGCPNQALRIKP